MNQDEILEKYNITLDDDDIRSEKMIVVYFKGDFYAYEYEGKTLAQVIRDYGLNRKMIREWYKK